MLLALATGVLYGIGAALTKGVVDLLDGGILAMLKEAWETYGLAIALGGGTVLYSWCSRPATWRRRCPR